MTTLSTAPTTARQFAVNLPESISQPKFQMFQRVLHTQGYAKGAQATIVGIQWVSRDSALLQQTASGWHYTLSEIWGITDPVELHQCDPSESIAPEACLVAVES